MTFGSLSLHACAVSVAIAVTSTGSSAQPVPTGVTAAQFADPRIIDLWAQCIVAKHRDYAAAFVLNSYREGRFLSTPESVHDKRCIPAQASSQDAGLMPKLSEDSIKVALAGALMRRELPNFDPAVINTARILPSNTLIDGLFPPNACKKCKPKQRAVFEDARAKLNNVMAPTIFGECAVRTDPANAHALIMSPYASAEEAAAFSMLGPAFSNCLGQGAQFTATRSVLRGLIAISYYRIAHAPRAKPAGAQR